ncbi:MAG: hypothetical protein EOL97_15690 [Spirochaetia bacterium]|nr:hypothetical protein [Spirochaetia bacterium]
MKVMFFEQWFELYMDDLMEEYIEGHLEDFHCADDFEDVLDNINFQDWVNERYETYKQYAIQR